MNQFYRNPTHAEHVMDIAISVILSVVTFGLYDLYWNYRQMDACNDLVGRPEFSWGMWFLLTIITCGIYHIFYQYKMASVIVEVQRNRGTHVFESLPVLSALVSLLGFGLIVDCIHQDEINKLCR
jgi:ABC-type thiamin/hydroxymethylpyrimidine transport system permease subunit